MIFRTFIAALFISFLALSPPVVAGEFATAADAQAMVDRAIAFYDKAGREAALKEFSNKQGQFIDRDLYVFAGDLNGVFLAHGANPGLIGKNLNDLKDVNGRMIGQEIVQSAKTKPDGGWVEYTWTNPATKKLAPKRTWVKGHDNLFIAAGVYDTAKATP
ncbi:MAG: cache domain-containing protein [Rhodospirillaceae bacterium]